jgi:hypothetical protein
MQQYTSMNNLSVAGIGMYVSLIEGVLHVFGFVPPEGSILAAINGAVAIVALATWIVGQFKRADLSLGLFRKY